MKANKKRMMVECKQQGVDHIYQLPLLEITKLHLTAQWKRGKVILKDWKMDILKKTFSSKEAMHHRPQETIQGQLARQDSSKGSRGDGFKADKRREGAIF